MKRKSNFTLIELLVVIAIIAILAGMLLPALNNARKSAKGVICTQRMKDICMAVQMYQSDYQKYPPYRMFQEAGNYSTMRYLPSLLSSPYLNNFMDRFSGDWTADGNDWQKLSYPFICPVEKPAFNPYYTAHKDGYYNLKSQMCFYGQNNTPPTRMASSSCVMVADAKVNNDGNKIAFWRGESAQTLINYIAPRHGDSANCGYFDGAVRKQRIFVKQNLTFDPNETETQSYRINSMLW